MLNGSTHVERSNSFSKRFSLSEKFNIFLIAFETAYTVFVLCTKRIPNKSFGEERIFFEVYVRVRLSCMPW